MLAHRRDPQISPCPRVAAYYEAAGREYVVPQELRRLIEQDDVHSSFRGEVGQGDRHRNLEGATRDPSRGG